MSGPSSRHCASSAATPERTSSRIALANGCERRRQAVASGEILLRAFLRFEFGDRGVPRLAVVARVTEDTLDPRRVLAHVGHDEFLVPKAVYAKEVLRKLAADLHVERTHEHRACALRAKQGLVNALDVVALVKQLLMRLLRRNDQHVEDLDNEILGRGRENRRFEIRLLVVLLHRRNYALDPDVVLVVEKPKTDANSCC